WVGQNVRNGLGLRPFERLRADQRTVSHVTAVPSTTPREHPHLLANYARAPLNFVRGEGSWLIDEQGDRYLDCVAGLAVCALGHAHPRIAQAVAKQAETLVHCS